jgi:hypothetical protein
MAGAALLDGAVLQVDGDEPGPAVAYTAPGRPGIERFLIPAFSGDMARLAARKARRWHFPSISKFPALTFAYASVVPVKSRDLSNLIWG